MNKYPRVKEVLNASKYGLENIKIYFNQEGMQIDPSTWCGHIKKSIDDGHVISAITEIELLKEKFNQYRNVSEEKRDMSGDNSVNN